MKQDSFNLKMKFWIEKSVIKLRFVWLLGTTKVHYVNFIHTIDVCFKDKAFVTCYLKASSSKTLYIIKAKVENSSTLINQYSQFFSE